MTTWHFDRTPLSPTSRDPNVSNVVDAMLSRQLRQVHRNCLRSHGRWCRSMDISPILRTYRRVADAESAPSRSYQGPCEQVKPKEGGRTAVSEKSGIASNRQSGPRDRFPGRALLPHQCTKGILRTPSKPTHEFVRMLLMAFSRSSRSA